MDRLKGTHDSDQELIARLKQGDNAAFQNIFELYHQSMYVYAKNLLRDQDEAKDLVQDIFTQLWDRSAQIQLRGTLEAYLYSAVRYRFLNLVAHKKVRTDYAANFQQLLEEGLSTTDEYIHEKELLVFIEREVAKLPEKMREVFQLSRDAGLSHKQIAEQLGITEVTVKSHVSHALKILRGKFAVSVIIVYLMI